MRIAFLLTSFLVLFIGGCKKSASTGEKLSAQHCGSCHLRPDPSLLDKRTWYNSVLPQMRFRMGYPNDNILATIPPSDRAEVLESIPRNPAISEEEWSAVFDYYIANAPDSLPSASLGSFPMIRQFEVDAIRQPEALVTFVDFDELAQAYLIGTGSGVLYKFDGDFSRLDSVYVGSAISHVESFRNGHLITAMGIMSPNDQARGKLVYYSGDEMPHQLLDSLRRPVFTARTDLNHDELDDFIVCNFGNFTGSLDVYQRLPDSTYRRHVISHLPGARMVILRDVNNDGATDIIALLTQGDERIVAFENLGKFRFREKTLLRFPPVYGSSYFQIHDFNHDNHFDILYSNGDNGDFSNVLKPYHGVRIFENGGDDTYTEKFFFQMPGASEAMAFDFDEDGDLDIAAVSFFPDFARPESGFVYLENKGDYQFEPSATPAAAHGRWLRMNIADVDGDGDTDIILGALSVRGLGARDEVYATWRRQKVAMLVLQNRRISQDE